MYNLKRKTWRRVYSNSNIDAEYWERMANDEPKPRFAHQFAFSARTGVCAVQRGRGGRGGGANDDLAVGVLIEVAEILSVWRQPGVHSPTARALVGLLVA